jgi:phosphatidylserine/phosphatidylglycerophosphate/cardiolipin synthase-like enzyme
MSVILYHDQALGRALPSIIDGATKSLDLCMYLLAPPSDCTHAAMRELWAALDRAPRRGVACRAVIHAGSRTWPGMEAGRRSVAALKASKWDAREWKGGKILHAKQLVIDGAAVVMGSHNWTQSALLANGEASTWIIDRHVAEAAAQWFELVAWRNSGRPAR